MNTWRRFRLAVAVVLAALSFTAHATPQNGWWWNPNESGRGFFLEWQGDVLFIVGYLYESDGRPTWLTAGGAMATPYTFTAPLTAYRDGQTLWGDYVPPGGWSNKGELRLEFSSTDRGVLTWPGGRIPIQRHVFASGDATFQPTGWWWNPEESGRGFSIEVQGDTLFMGAFMYDGAGNPEWYVSAGKLASPTRYSGTLQRVSGGQTIDGPYKSPSAYAQAGTIEIEFLSAEEATVTWSGQGVLAPEAPAATAASYDGTAIVAAPMTRSTRVRPLLSRPPPLAAAPARFSGLMYKRYTTPQLGGELDWTIEAPNSVWSRNGSPTAWPAVYAVTSATAQLSVRGTGGGGACTITGQTQLNWEGMALYFVLAKDGTFTDVRALSDMEVSVELTLNCGENSTTFAYPLPMDFEAAGGRLDARRRLFSFRVPVMDPNFYLSYGLVLEPTF